MEKSCNSNGPCIYRTIGGTFIGCNYTGYCDFQLPRDSRGWQMPITTEEEEYCEYCHFPIRKCKGHTICKGKD